MLYGQRLEKGEYFPYIAYIFHFRLFFFAFLLFKFVI